MPVKTVQFSPTQKDIAKSLNVSQACVAIALDPKQRGKLLPETVARVEAKARELNYRPRKQARTLRSGRSYTIAVVYIDYKHHYHAPQERVRYLNQCAIQEGYQLVPMNLSWFYKKTGAAGNYLMDMAVEGIVLSNLKEEQAKEWFQFSRRYQLPIVSAEQTNLPCDWVGCDLVSAFREITLHHIKQGSRNLHLQLPFHDPLPRDFKLGGVIADRIRGFKEAIQSVGGEVVTDSEESELLKLPTVFSNRNPKVRGYIHYPLRLEHYDYVIDAGYHEMLGHLKKGAIDSLVASNDDIAIGARTACLENGIRIPEQIKLSGADNAPFGRYGRSPLTTIDQPSKAIAEWCIKRLVRLIKNPKERKSPKNRTFPCEVIYRASTINPVKARNASIENRKAFTLVELLVTITVIAILIGIAFTGIGAIRAAVDSAKCIGNLKASGEAMIRYFHDNDGNFFPNKNWFQYPSTKPGVNRGMREYFGIIAENDTKAVIQDEIFARDTILTCSAMKRKYPNLYPSGLNRGYAINYYLQQKDPNNKYDSFPSSERPLLEGSYQKMINVPSLSKMWILTEAPVNGGLLSDLNEYTAAHAGNFMSLPHKGKQKVFFFDGHVETLERHDFTHPP